MKTLKIKITVLVSVILFATMAMLTAYSLFNSNKHFVMPIVAHMKFISAETIDANLASTAESFYPIMLEKDGMTSSVASLQTIATEGQKAFGIEQFLVMFLIVLIGVLLTYMVLLKSLKPLAILNTATMETDGHNLDKEISVPNSHDEIATLTSSFNNMLKRLQHSFEVQKNFAQNAAHELKTPLSVIKSSIQVLEMDDMPSVEDYKENLSIVKQSTEELINLVGQLLSLTDVNDLVIEKIYLEKIVNECLDEHSIEIRSKNITVTTNSLETQINSNYLLIKSVLSNIISNAVKYNKENGKIDINISEENTILKVKISDTGIGINEKNINSVFEPFYRADESRSKKIQGNGLGLSIARTICQTLGAEIYIVSSLDTGTTVNITFPL